MGVGEAGSFGGHHEGGAEGDFQSARHAGAVDGADRRLGQGSQGPAGVDGELALAGVEGGIDLFEVDPGGERRVGPGDDQGARVGSRSTASTRSQNWRRMATVRAFRASGRWKVMVRIPSLSSTSSWLMWGP